MEGGAERRGGHGERLMAKPLDGWMGGWGMRGENLIESMGMD